MTYRIMDVSEFVARLGDPTHGLRASKTIEVRTDPTVEGKLPDVIYLASSGPVTTSTCTSMVLLSSARVEDANRYYWSLGIKWPTRATTKKQLRKAYQRKKGYSSPWLTYCLKQLLNPVVRAEYDSRPLGRPISDRYTEAALRREAKLWSLQKGVETGVAHDPDDFLEQELGIKLNDDGEVVDDTADPHVEQHRSFSGWPYAFYLWRSRKHDDEALSEWQSMLVSAFSAKGLSMQIAVGYCGDTPESWTERVHAGNLVLFLNEESLPTRELAEAAASQIHSRIHPVS